MKQVIKNTIGAGNARKIAQFRKAARISTNRLIRTILGEKEILPSPQPQTFALTDAHVFFGYYDVPQVSCDEILLLGMAIPLTNKTPVSAIRAQLGFFDMREKEPQFRVFGCTPTWCWQQGCRLQWYPNDSERFVIYNTMVEDLYGSVILDIKLKKIIRSFLRPIYTVTKDGRYALSLNFSRLQRLRPGYGYSLLPDQTAEDRMPAFDGIWRLDMKSGKEELLFSVRDVALRGTRNGSAYNQHYFNHVLYNPSGTRFMFFHVTQTSAGKRKIRMFTAKADGTDIHLVNDSGHVSHYCWRDDNDLLCYSTVVGKGEGYYLYDDHTGEIQVVGAGSLKEDGHPSYLPGGRWLITDTYPDKCGESSLLLYNLENAELIPLYKTYVPPVFTGETRCDLHPRVSSSGRLICIDCIESGKRVMKLFDVSSMTSECSTE